MSFQELNEIYKLAHFMKQKELKKTICIYLACTVCIPLTKEDYKVIKEKLGVKNDLSG